MTVRILVVFLVLAALRGLPFPSFSNPTPTADTRSVSVEPGRRFDNFDIRLDRREVSPDATPDEVRRRRQGLDRLKARVPDLSVTWNYLTGMPHCIHGPTGRLTKPVRNLNPEAELRRFLRDNLDFFGLESTDLSPERLKPIRRYSDQGTGTTHVSFQQHVGGIEIFGCRVQGHFAADGALLKIDGDLVPVSDQGVNIHAPTLDVETAIRAAATDIGLDPLAPLRLIDGPTGADRRTRFEGLSPTSDDIQTRLMFFPMNRHETRLTWSIVLGDVVSSDVFHFLVDAETGDVLSRTSLVRYQTQPASFRVYPKDSPTPGFPGPPKPNGLDPAIGERELRTDAPNPVASPLGWIPDGGTTTNGNNVDAYIDLAGINAPNPGLLDGNGRAGASNRNFDFPIDLSRPPTTADNRRSALAHVFYWANRYHDLLYELGFDEAAGNFQNDNFGRGGLDNDRVRIEVQDANATPGNANFQFTPDGESSRAQFGLFVGPDPDRDSALDTVVVFHELTHGLNNRLAGGPSTFGVLLQTQSWAIDEGTADFFGVTLTSQPDDDLDGIYPFAAYVFRHVIPSYVDNAYFGSRRYPYSTDMTKNPLTYRMIADKSLPSNVPRSPVNGSPAPSSQQHAAGEVWCSGLWECRANLIRQYGFEVGTRTILQLVVDGLKFSSPNPNYLELRDAILLADRVRYGGVNQCLLWRGFAKRGMGASASSPSAHFVTGIVEAFDVPPECAGPRAIRVAAADRFEGLERLILPGEDRVPIVVELENPLAAQLDITGATVASTVPGVTVTSPGLQFPSLPGGGGRARPVAPFTFSVAANVPCGSVPFELKLETNQGPFTARFVVALGITTVGKETVVFSDNVEKGNNGWRAQSPWQITTAQAHSSTRSWTDSPNGQYAKAVTVSLTSPELKLTGLADLTLTFFQAYTIDRSDVGAVEVSGDGGKTWRRVAGFSGSEPDFKRVTLDLPMLDGADRALIRFKFSSSQFFGVADGWYIDDIEIRAKPLLPDCPTLGR